MGKLGHRRCFWHWLDCGDYVEAVASYYHVGEYRRIWVCQECLARYGGTCRDIEYRSDYELELRGINLNQKENDDLEPFDKNCEHEMFKQNMVTEEDSKGMYDLMECKKCGGQRKRRGF